VSPGLLRKQMETVFIQIASEHASGEYMQFLFGEVIHISESTVRRMAHKHGFHSRICRRKMVSAVNKQKRLLWAEENKERDWRRVMFTDEACFHVGETARQRVIRRHGTESDLKHPSVKSRPGKAVHVWGSILHGCKMDLVRFKLAPAHTVNGIRLAGEKITFQSLRRADPGRASGILRQPGRMCPYRRTCSGGWSLSTLQRSRQAHPRAP